MEREPADIGRLPRIAKRNTDHLRILDEITVADYHALRRRGRSGCVLEKRNLVAPRSGQLFPPRRPIGAGVVDEEPLDPRRAEAFDQIRARSLDPIAAAYDKTGRAIRQDRRAGIARAVTPWKHHRHGDHPG